MLPTPSSRPRSLLKSFGLMLMSACAMLGLVAIARQAQPYVPVGDIALLETYTMLAEKGQLLVGPYSRFLWHHPGPLSFFILAPFHVLSGHLTAGLSAGAVAINLASVLALIYFCRRWGGRTLAAIVAVTIALFVLRVPDLLTSPWNPHTIVLPAALMVVLAAGVVSGHVRLLPLLVAVASFVAQTHVGLVPLAAALVGSALAGTLWQALHSHVSIGRTIGWSAGALLVLWIPPLIDQLTSPSGNLAELTRFFLEEQRIGQPFALAFAAWADSLNGVFTSGFELAYGGRFEPTGAALAAVAAIAQVLLVAAAAVWHQRRGEFFKAAFAALLVLSSGVALMAVSRVESELIDHLLFWISMIGAMNVATLVDTVIALRRSGSLFSVPYAATAATVAAVLCVVGVGIRQLQETVAGSADPGSQSGRAQALSQEPSGYLRSHPGSVPVVKLHQPIWPIVAGALLQLQKEGVRYSVDREWVPIFSSALGPTGQENTTIVFTRDSAVAPGDEVIAEYRSLVILIPANP